MQERDILFERGPYWIKAADTFVGFEVYRTIQIHSVRVASIGWTGTAGLDRAKAEIERRIAQ
jgi:hypothetical protein